MSSATDFFQHTRSRYLQVNRAALEWQLSRMTLDQPLINTKLNSISLHNYTAIDGLRGPQFMYGWIQGRGLEAMATQAAFLKNYDLDLSRRLDVQAGALYLFLNNLYTKDKAAYFCYDQAFKPICSRDPTGLTPQLREDNLYSYADLFVTKGLIAAAHRHAPEDLPAHLLTLSRIINAIKDGRFIIAESDQLTELALMDQAADFGPRMIALGAAALLHRLNLNEHDNFSGQFIQHILDHHLDAPTGLLANEPGGNVCNIGHGIEFAGFTLEIYRESVSAELATKLCRIIAHSFHAGFNGTGLPISINLPSLTPINANCPWWSLSETIRAASLGYAVSGDIDLFDIWQAADTAFFTHFWRNDPPIAYQTLTSNGPVDYVPATADLDPGYHTGLSLLAAIEAAERIL